MTQWKLCESEYRFMRLVWEHEPLPSHRLVELCAQHFEWKKSTTYTVLKRLCERGVVQNQEATVTSLVSCDQVQAYASEYFVDNTFSGSLPEFLVSFLRNKTVTEEEAEELKRLIDAHMTKGGSS